jgi:hypothetical protein
VHERRHPKTFEVAIGAAKQDLARIPTLMMSVSLKAAFPEGLEEAQGYLTKMDLRTGFVHFNGRSVDTKFGKSFTTGFFPMGGPCEQIVRDWIAELRGQHHFSNSSPLFPKTRVGVGASRRFEALGIDRAPWSGASSAAKIFKQAFIDAGLPPFSPHRVRDTLAELARDHCRTPEDYKAWSQNMGHDDVLTTFNSYGSVAAGRHVDLMARFRRRGPLRDDDDFDVLE